MNSLNLQWNKTANLAPQINYLITIEPFYTGIDRESGENCVTCCEPNIMHTN